MRLLRAARSAINASIWRRRASISAVAAAMSASSNSILSSRSERAVWVARSSAIIAARRSSRAERSSASADALSSVPASSAWSWAIVAASASRSLTVLSSRSPKWSRSSTELCSSELSWFSDWRKSSLAERSSESMSASSVI